MHYDSRQIADAIQQKPTTVRQWTKLFDIPAERSGPELRFNDEALRIFQVIKKLKGDGSGTQTIRKRIAPELHQNNPRDPQDTHASQTHSVDIRAEIKAALSESNDLSEKYARATYKIGELEAEKRIYLEQLAEAREKIKLLEAPKEEPVPEPVKQSWWARLWQ